MSRQERMQRKVYRAQRSSLRWAAAAMAAASLWLLAAGVLNSHEDESQLAVEPSLTPAPTPVTRTFDESADSRQITVPATPWYAIQLGVFEAEESAGQQAEMYRSRGAAGYVWQDGERYRVLAAVYPSEEDAKVYHDEFKVCCGEHPAGETRNWETISELVARTRRVLDRYLEAGYEKIAVVGHGGLIRRYTGERVIGYCHVSEIEYTKDFVCFDWVP